MLQTRSRSPLSRFIVAATALGLVLSALPTALNAQGSHSRTPSANGASLLASPRGLNSYNVSISAMAYDDANDKVYVGGSFSSVNDAGGTVTTDALVRLNADGTIDESFTVQTGDDSEALLIHGDYIYVGGEFSNGGSEDNSDSGGSVRADNVFRINRDDGLIDRDWIFSGQSDTYALARITGSVNRIVLGMDGSGFLRAVNELDSTDIITFTGFDNDVASLAVDGSKLYVGGLSFGTGGTPDYLRRYTYNGSNAFTLDSAWNPKVTNSDVFDDEVTELLVVGDHLYVGGEFNDSSDDDLEYLVRIPLNSSDGAIDTSWSHGGIDNDIDALVVHDDYLYVGGFFEQLNSRLLRYDLREAYPRLDMRWLPSISHSLPNQLPITISGSINVYALAVTDTRVFVGGRFGSINGVDVGGGLASVDSAPLNIPPAPKLNTAVSGSGRGPYTLRGTARAGSEVLVYDGSALLGSVIAGGNGSWQFTTGDNLASGGHRFSAKARPVYQLGTMMRSLSAASNVVDLEVTVSSTPQPAQFNQALTGGGDCEIVGCSGGSLELEGAGDGDLLNPFDVANTAPAAENHVTISAAGAAPANSAVLIIRAEDVDWITNEYDYVYLNGHQLGTLTGRNNIWSTTTFPIPDLDWVVDGENVLQFRITTAGEQFQDNWTVQVSAASLILDDATGNDATLDTFSVAPPSGSIAPQTVFTPLTEGDYRVVFSLFDPSGNMLESSSSDLSAAAGATAVVSTTLSLPSGNLTGYTVRSEVLFLSLEIGTYVLQDRADYTFTSTSLSVSGDGLGATSNLIAQVTPPSNNRTPVRGTVEFYSGANLLGSAEISADGRATLPFTSLSSTGSYSARYLGNTRFSGSSSDSVDAVFSGCATPPDIAVSPAEIFIAPGGSAELTITVRNLCSDRPWGPSDLLLSLSDGLNVGAIPDGWLNLGQRASLPGLRLAASETRSWTISVAAAGELPTAPIFVLEHYFLGSAGQRIDGILLLTDAAPVAAPTAEPVAEPTAEPVAEPTATPEVTLPAALPNTADGRATPAAWPAAAALLCLAGALILLRRRLIR
jgi:hypothetical protein